MMKIAIRSVWLMFFLLLGLDTAQAAPDEIDSFVKGFNTVRFNGGWPCLDLPADSSPEKLVQALTEKVDHGNPNGRFSGYRIIKTKKIDPTDSRLGGFTVILIASAIGSKTIILLDYPATNPNDNMLQSKERDLPHRWSVWFFPFVP